MNTAAPIDSQEDATSRSIEATDLAQSRPQNGLVDIDPRAVQPRAPQVQNNTPAQPEPVSDETWPADASRADPTEQQANEEAALDRQNQTYIRRLNRNLQNRSVILAMLRAMRQTSRLSQTISTGGQEGPPPESNSNTQTTLPAELQPNGGAAIPNNQNRAYIRRLNRNLQNRSVILAMLRAMRQASQLAQTASTGTQGGHTAPFRANDTEPHSTQFGISQSNSRTEWLVDDGKASTIDDAQSTLSVEQQLEKYANLANIDRNYAQRLNNRLINRLGVLAMLRTMRQDGRLQQISQVNSDLTNGRNSAADQKVGLSPRNTKLESAHSSAARREQHSSAAADKPLDSEAALRTKLDSSHLFRLKNDLIRLSLALQAVRGRPSVATLVEHKSKSNTESDSHIRRIIDRTAEQPKRLITPARKALTSLRRFLVGVYSQQFRQPSERVLENQEPSGSIADLSGQQPNNALNTSLQTLGTIGISPREIRQISTLSIPSKELQQPAVLRQMTESSSTASNIQREILLSALHKHMLVLSEKRTVGFQRDVDLLLSKEIDGQSRRQAVDHLIRREIRMMMRRLASSSEIAQRSALKRALREGPDTKIKLEKDDQLLFRQLLDSVVYSPVLIVMDSSKSDKLSIGVSPGRADLQTTEQLNRELARQKHGNKIDLEPTAALFEHKPVLYLLDDWLQFYIPPFHLMVRPLHDFSDPAVLRRKKKWKVEPVGESQQHHWDR